jgi:hypothetical protein
MGWEAPTLYLVKPRRSFENAESASSDATGAASEDADSANANFFLEFILMHIRDWRLRE